MKITAPISFLVIFTCSLITSDAISEYFMPLRRNRHFKPDAVSAVQRARYRYSRFLAKPVETKSRIGNPGVGSVSVQAYRNDIEYYGEIQIGTPPQSLHIDFDTGSADFWFASSLCSSCGTEQAKFNPNASSTFKEDGTAWKIVYGDKSTSGGFLGYDVVRLGELTIEHQAIQLATSESDSLKTGDIDGLMGLAFPSLATVKNIDTPMTSLIKNHLIKEPILGVYLRKSSKGGGGEFVFGGYNPQHFEGSLDSVPVDSSEGYWKINVDTLSVAGQTLFQMVPSVIDTGTSLLIFPTKVAKAIAKKYNAVDNLDGSFTIDCDATRLEPLVFTMGGTAFQVPPDSLVFSNNTHGSCVAGFGYTDYPFAILGDVFIKNNYIVFDYETPEIRIAPVKD